MSFQNCLWSVVSETPGSVKSAVNIVMIDMRSWYILKELLNCKINSLCSTMIIAPMFLSVKTCCQSFIYILRQQKK